MSDFPAQYTDRTTEEVSSGSIAGSRTVHHPCGDVDTEVLKIGRVNSSVGVGSSVTATVVAREATSTLKQTHPP